VARVRDRWKEPARKGKGKRWLGIWQLGDGSEASKAFTTRDAALRFAQAQETDIDRGNYISPKDARVTVGQFCDIWLKGYATRRPSTVRQARVHVAQIKAEFGKSRLGAVRPSRITAWTARLKTEGHEASYVYALHSRLSQIMRAAHADGLISRNPCSRDTSPGSGSQRPYVITTEQLWALHAAMPPYLQVAVLLGAMAGLRVAEACGLRPGDVDLALGIVRPQVQYPAEDLKTPTSMTDVPVPYSLTTEVLAHMAMWPGPWVLTDEDGQQVGPWRLERAIRSARKKVAGLPEGFRYHDLRHYLASFLIAHGADVKLVQARLRHKSAKTTLDTYGHLWPDRDESTRAALEIVFAARPDQSRTKTKTNQETGRSDPQ
jgi:integrase